MKERWDDMGDAEGGGELKLRRKWAAGETPRGAAPKGGAEAAAEGRAEVASEADGDGMRGGEARAEGGRVGAMDAAGEGPCCHQAAGVLARAAASGDADAAAGAEGWGASELRRRRPRWENEVWMLLPSERWSGGGPGAVAGAGGGESGATPMPRRCAAKELVSNEPTRSASDERLKLRPEGS